MKKIVAIVLTLVMCVSCFGIVGQAKVGDVIGKALHTDIVVYINHYAIPSYAVNGQSVIVAEDLRNFGFDVVWDGYNRSLTIYRNGNSNVSPMFVGKGNTTGSKYTDILSTDISVWAGGQRLTSYAMNGYTMIPVEQLTMLGSVNWVASERALKMWVDGLAILDEKQEVSKRYYDGTTAPDFGWVTESICLEKDSKMIYYYADSTKYQQYVNYIKKQGYSYDKTIEVGTDGLWYSCYVNKKTRTGIAVAELEGIVVVQFGTNMDYWTY